MGPVTGAKEVQGRAREADEGWGGAKEGGCGVGPSEGGKTASRAEEARACTEEGRREAARTGRAGGRLRGRAERGGGRGREEGGRLRCRAERGRLRGGAERRREAEGWGRAKEGGCAADSGQSRARRRGSRVGAEQGGELRSGPKREMVPIRTR